jgi:uncharacterized membrane protein
MTITTEFAWWSHLAATFIMVGVIWTIQLVHYPLMDRVASEKFVEFEADHQSRISFIVLPTMLVEAALAIWLTLRPPVGISSGVMLICGLLLAGVWLSTFFLQVPMHNRLSKGFDAEAHRFLVHSNWLRTVLWSARGGLLLWLSALLKPIG